MRISPTKPWARIEQALRVTDLLLQAGGFSAIVLDMASISAEYVSRVSLATWFRYRAAGERTQAIFLLLTQYSCAKSSGELLLRFKPGEARGDEAAVFRGSNTAWKSSGGGSQRETRKCGSFSQTPTERERRATGEAKQPGQLGDDEACRNIRLRFMRKEFPAQALLRLRPGTSVTNHVWSWRASRLSKRYALSLAKSTKVSVWRAGMTQVEVDTFSEATVLSKRSFERGSQRRRRSASMRRLLFASASSIAAMTAHFCARSTLREQRGLFGPPETLARNLLIRVRHSGNHCLPLL